MVAQRFAIDHPVRVAGLGLVGAFSTLYRDRGLSDFVASSIDPLADPIPAAFALEWQLSTTARPIEPRFLETVVRETAKVPARVWRAAHWEDPAAVAAEISSFIIEGTENA